MANVQVLSLHGDFDSSRRQWLDEELGKIEQAGPGATLILDLTHVTYLDTTFINALLRFQRRLIVQQPASSVCIAAPTRFISRLFEITEMNRTFQIFHDLSAAYQCQYVLSLKDHMPTGVEVEKFGL